MRSSTHAIVAPPSSAAETLSGCPSKSVASAMRSLSLINCWPERTSPRARLNPPTIAPADDPSPRPCGIVLSARSAIPRGFPPINSKPRIIDLMTRFFPSRGMSSAPSPVTSISKPSSSSICATYTSRRSRAKPSASKPGPRFADDAGTET